MRYSELEKLIKQAGCYILKEGANLVQPHYPEEIPGGTAQDGRSSDGNP